jgi:hypothetical protein
MYTFRECIQLEKTPKSALSVVQRHFSGALRSRFPKP